MPQRFHRYGLLKYRTQTSQVGGRWDAIGKLQMLYQLGLIVGCPDTNRLRPLGANNDGCDTNDQQVTEHMKPVEI